MTQISMNDYTSAVSQADISPNTPHKPMSVALFAREKVRAKLARIKAQGGLKR